MYEPVKITVPCFNANVGCEKTVSYYGNPNDRPLKKVCRHSQESGAPSERLFDIPRGGASVGGTEKSFLRGDYSYTVAITAKPKKSLF